MRYAIPTLFLGSPALAHPSQLPHSHAADWAVTLAFLLIGAGVVAARHKAIRIRGRQ